MCAGRQAFGAEFNALVFQKERARNVQLIGTEISPFVLLPKTKGRGLKQISDLQGGKTTQTRLREKHNVGKKSVINSVPEDLWF